MRAGGKVAVGGLAGVREGLSEVYVVVLGSGEGRTGLRVSVLGEVRGLAPGILKCFETASDTDSW